MLPALLMAGNLGMQAYSAYQKSEAAKAKHRFEEKQRLKAERQSRRDALGRAVGGRLEFKPEVVEKPPNLNDYQTKAGIANIGSMTLADILAHPEWFTGGGGGGGASGSFDAISSGMA